MHENKNNVTRNLLLGSEKKKDRMIFADPEDHSFSYKKRFVNRESVPFSVSNYDLASMPIIKGGPLTKIS